MGEGETAGRDSVPDNLRLVAPSVEYRDSYIAALREHQAQGRFLDSRHVDNDIARIERDFASLVRSLRAATDPAKLQPGHVPETFFWLIDGAGEVVGRSSIRHELSDEPALRDIGHIGYDIRPSRQGRGYGRAILGLTLREARRLGMTGAVLVTCDSNNLPSKRIIEHWNGRFERAVPLPGRSYTRLRYWVPLDQGPA
jgi:predicted acetyltransferase